MWLYYHLSVHSVHLSVTIVGVPYASAPHPLRRIETRVIYEKKARKGYISSWTVMWYKVSGDMVTTWTTKTINMIYSHPTSQNYFERFLNCHTITASKLDWNTLVLSLTSAFLYLYASPTISCLTLSVNKKKDGRPASSFSFKDLRQVSTRMPYTQGQRWNRISDICCRMPRYKMTNPPL